MADACNNIALQYQQHNRQLLVMCRVIGYHPKLAVCLCSCMWQWPVVQWSSGVLPLDAQVYSHVMAVARPLLGRCHGTEPCIGTLHQPCTWPLPWRSLQTQGGGQG